MLIAELIHRFLDHCAGLVDRKQLQASTLKNYRNYARHIESIAHLEVASLKARDVRAWHAAIPARVRAERGADGLAVANRALVLLGSAISFGVTEEFLPPSIPVTRSVRLFVQRRRTRFLSPAEITAVCNALLRLERQRLRDGLTRSATQALLLLILTGMRKNEALKLRVSEVDLRHKLLKLPFTKTGYREVPLSDAAALLLRAQMRFASGGWMFPAKNGREPIRQIYEVWRTALELSEIDRVGVVVHTLRHSLITDILRHGADIKTAADVAGHQDLDITRNTYGRPLATVDGRQAVNDFAARIGATSLLGAA
nr:site-specific integrase [Nannocystis sp. ILAH1]